MADQRDAVVKVVRETGLFVAEAFLCVGQLPEAVRDSAITRLEKRRDAFQHSVDKLYDLMQQDQPAAGSAEIACILERLCKVEKENQELRRRAEERPAVSSAEVARISERLLKLERENQELRRGQGKAQPVPATLTSPSAACAEPEAEEVLMNDRFATGITLSFSGGLAQEGGKIVKREDASERWTAGGIAYVPKIEAGTRKGVQFQPCQKDMSLMLGFQYCTGLPSPPHSMGELEIAAHCAKDGTLEIFSQGERITQCGKYRPSSIVELSITEAGEVGLFVDGQFQFRLATPPRFPLYVAASFLTPGAAIRGLMWTEGTPLADVPPPAPAPPPGPRGPVNFVGMCNGLQQMQPGHLRKTGGADGNWGATAVSSESLIIGRGRGLRFRPGTRSSYFFLGLGSGSSPPVQNNIDYPIYCSPSGAALWCRSGQQSTFFPYSGNVYLDLLVYENRLELHVDGVLKHTARLSGDVGRLFAMASFQTVGAKALEIQWL